MQTVAGLPVVSETTPVGGGCSNRALGADPDKSVGWKNTVTNALYFNLSMQLFEFLEEFPNSQDRVKPSDCLSSAYQQYSYFKNWFAVMADPPTIPDNFWHTLGDTAYAMIEERPVAYPPWVGYDPTGTSVPWVKHGMWTGDQGLFVNASALMGSKARER